MKLKLRPKTKLQRHVAKWLREEGKSREDGVEGVARDLFYGGCASGLVGHLIWTRDCAEFYRKHASEIDAMVSDLICDMGEPINFQGWDHADPFAREDSNRNILAWFGFEEAARALCSEAGIDC